MSTATLNLFYASEDFKNFEDEYVDGVGTNSAKLGDRYKGLLVDQLTPLEHNCQYPDEQCHSSSGTRDRGPTPRTGRLGFFCCIERLWFETLWDAYEGVCIGVEKNIYRGL